MSVKEHQVDMTPWHWARGSLLVLFFNFHDTEVNFHLYNDNHEHSFKGNSMTKLIIVTVNMKQSIDIINVTLCWSPCII